MTHALVTIIAPLPLAKIPDAEAAIDQLGNPATDAIRTALVPNDDAALHFASLHAFASRTGKGGYILLEFSADGTETDVIAYVAKTLGTWLLPIFMMAEDWSDPGDLGRYLTSHRDAIGPGLFDNPGLAFAGTPGMSVPRILFEARLEQAIAGEIGRQDSDGDGRTALARLDEIRQVVARDSTLAPALQTATADPPFAPASLVTLLPTLAASFVTTYLWPFVIPVAAIAVISGISAAAAADGFWAALGAFPGHSIMSLLVALVVLLVAIGVLYLQLRKAEDRDSVDDRVVPIAVNAAMFARENRAAQNHMISITQRKPGLIRWLTSRLVFWLIGNLSGRLYPPGFLGEIGTIHFARWVTAPGSRDVIFLSNYGGSWESYLEDFITRAHAGLTAVWSNTVGFPRTQNLFQDGATDGDRFKRFARHSMIPTRFWYCAYPTLTTAQIRTNAEIRRGLSGAMTEDDAGRWLALFGSAPRPAPKLVSSEIQSIMFGGLGFMPFGVCLVLHLPDDASAARAWLRDVLPRVAFDDGRRLGATAVVSLALGAGGLRRLGLSDDSLATFPFAFVEGMTTEPRSRILGDFGDNGPDNWSWGKTQPDAALLVYGRSAAAVAELEGTLERIGAKHGLDAPYRIPLLPVEKTKTEPFGFVDGISQPVIRGTYKGRRDGDPIHLVEAGEFILGYPDNRGNMPPVPILRATADPTNTLPLLADDLSFGRTDVETDRDVGFNGSFLVIRQLEQDVGGFDRYCEEEAARLKNRLPPPYNVTPDFIAAKLIGRWRDGSSLVRHPYESHSHYRERVERHHATLAAAGEGLMTESADDVSTRAKTKAPAATPIDPPPPTRDTEASLEDTGHTYPDNTFLLGTEDPQGLRCPFGAHIRRSNPRDSLDPGSQDQIDITNRHRIIRIGRQYAPEDGRNPGLLFMCLNGDIERQFEFLQQSWLRSPSFHGLSCEKDPVLGDAETGNCGFTVPSPYGPIRLTPLPRFVTMRGGGYFFLPGKRLLWFLGGTDGDKAN